MTPPIAHVATGIEIIAGGNPLYDVLPGHEAVLITLALLPVGGWLLERRAEAGGRRATRLVSAYRALVPAHRLLAWLLSASAAIHLALAVGHGNGHAGEPNLTAAFLADGALLALAAYGLVMRTRWWRPLAGLTLLGGIVAWWATSLGGEPPDQAGLITKLLELLALAIVLRPAPGRRVRGVIASSTFVALTVLTATAAWAGASAVADPEHAETAGHALLPGPGTVFPPMPDGPPTDADRAMADRLLAETRTATAPFTDSGVAAAAGYRLDGLHGSAFHATNPGFEQDGRILDPARPEMLVFAETNRGPVLLGAVFTTPGASDEGPRIAGPLVMWHNHEHVCVSLTPPSLTGIASPLGGCPFGSVDVPLTAQMLHVWTVPGAPDPFGDLPDDWVRAYLANVAP